MKCCHLSLFKYRGSALAYVITILMIISIISLSMLNLFNSNLKQTKYNQDKLEAYYLSYSGALIGYEALLANYNAKLDALFNGNTISSSTILFDNGTVEVSVVISTDVGFENWVKITSEAILAKNDIDFTRIMYFDPADPLDILWKND